MEGKDELTSNLFDLIFEQSLQPITITSLNKGVYLAVNPAFEKSTGYAKREVIGRSASAIEIWTDKLFRKKLVEKLKHNRLVSDLETCFRRKDGTVGYTKISARIIKYDDECCILGYFEDFSYLRERELLFQQTINNLPIGVFRSNADGQIMAANKAMARILGCNTLSDLYQHPEDFYYLEGVDRRERMLKDLEKYGVLLGVAGQAKKSDGTIIWLSVNYKAIFDEKNKIRFIDGTVEDITEQTLTRERFEIFDEAIKQSSSCFMITDSKGVVKFVNPAFTQITGYSQEEVLNRKSGFLQSGLVPEQVYKDLWNTILSHKSWKGEFTNKRKNGEIYWERMIISPIVNKHGKITHFVAIENDITDEKKLINDLIVAKEKAEESSKLKSAFLANMSHEIRTPLNSIVGFTELFVNDEIDTPYRDDFKRYITESTNQLLNIVTDVLEMSVISTQQIELTNREFDINVFVTEVSNSYKRIIQNKKLRLEIEKPLENGVCLINTDAAQLKKVFEKLFNNAIKYTNDGKITLGYKCVKNKIRIYLKDTGIGIPKGKQDIIYESFSQGTNELTREFGGLGLGLSIARKICTHLNVAIGFTSGADNGATFFIEIPQEKVRIVAPTIENEFFSLGLASSQKIMIAENNEKHYKHIKNALESQGFQTTRLENGTEIISHFQRHEGIVLGIIAVDIALLGGWQAIKLLKRENPLLPVIALSEQIYDGDMQRTRIAGADHLFEKPIRYEILIEHINQLIVRKRT